MCGRRSRRSRTKLPSAALEAGSGSAVIAQGDYNLTLAAAAQGADTMVYAGTSMCIDAAWRRDVCSGIRPTRRMGVCIRRAWRRRSMLLAALGTLLFVGNDGGIYRSTDGVNETGAACNANDAAHFDNLNGGIGSLAEVVSFAQDPVDAGTLLTGLGALGTARYGQCGRVLGRS